MNQRRGVSLAELLVTMSACTVILTMSAALIHRVMHTHSKIRAFENAERSALRLSSAFRGDVRQANQAVTNAASLEDNVLCRLQLGAAETVEYRHVDGTITRRHTQSGQPTAHEAFGFPPEIDVAVRQEQPRRLELTITSPLTHVPAGDQLRAAAFAIPVNLHVEANLSRDSSSARLVPSKEGS